MSVAAAFIQVIGVVGAALASIYLWRHRVAVEKDFERQEERVRDLLVAIRAEITIELRILAKQFDRAKRQAVKAAFIATLRDDRLRGKPSATLFIFEDIKSELGLLPIGCIDEIVEFYKNNSRLDSLLTAFASGDYSGIDALRQGKAIEALMELGEDTLRSGLAAKREINVFLAKAHRVDERWSKDEADVWSRLIAAPTE